MNQVINKVNILKPPKELDYCSNASDDSHNGLLIEYRMLDATEQPTGGHQVQKLRIECLAQQNVQYAWLKDTLRLILWHSP